MTPEDIRFYTEEDCISLAWQLHTKTGWPIMVLCDEEGAEGLGWVHAGVKDLEGKIWDIRGPRDAQEFLNEDLWYYYCDEGEELKFIEVTDLERISWKPQDSLDEKRAEKMAEELLAAYSQK